MTTHSDEKAPFGGILRTWGALSFGLGALDAFVKLVPPVPQIIIVILTILLALGFKLNQSFRTWSLAIEPRRIVAFHLVRFVGFYFLMLNSVGRLPAGFARPAGFGDIAVASGSMILLLTGSSRVGRLKQWYLAWNIFGLADIVMVVVLAAREGLKNPESMRELLHLPLSMLPTFVVPLIIASHLLLFVLLSREASTSES